MEAEVFLCAIRCLARVCKRAALEKLALVARAKAVPILCVLMDLWNHALRKVAHEIFTSALILAAIVLAAPVTAAMVGLLLYGSHDL